MPSASPFPATALALRLQVRTAVRAAMLLAAAGLLALVASGFLVAALYLWLLPALGAAAAAALTGLVLLALAALIFGGYQAWRGQRLPPPNPSAALAGDLLAMIRANPMEAVLLALAAGMSTGGGRR